MQSVQYLLVIIFLKTFVYFFLLITKSTKLQVLGPRRAIFSVPLNTNYLGSAEKQTDTFD